MKRLFISVIALCAVVFGIWADSQTELNRHLKAYNAQMAASQYLPAARSAAAAAAICAQAKNYDGAFRFLSANDKALAERHVTADSLPAVFYTTERARFIIYRSLADNSGAGRSLARMAGYAKKAGSKELSSDMLFNEAQYYYAVNQTAKGDLCIAHLIKQYDQSNDYKSADKAYQQLIDRAVSANDARMVEHTYENYMRWSDSIEAVMADTELGKVRQEYAESQETIAEKDHTIKTRTGWIVTFVTLFVIALAALGVGAMFYWRVMVKNRRMKKSVQTANDESAAKSAILHNMSSQMEPTLEQLDQNDPAVRNLRGYVRRVGELSDVGSSASPDEEAFEEVNLQTFCNAIAAKIRPMLRGHVSLNLDGCKGYARIDAPEVEKILTHLLGNAAKHTPEGGKITLAYRKRGAKSHQFIVTDTSKGIPENERENLFKPFAIPTDISKGARLGLPICALRAEKINGSLTLGPSVTTGASFILTLRS